MTLSHALQQVNGNLDIYTVLQYQQHVSEGCSSRAKLYACMASLTDMLPVKYMQHKLLCAS